MKRVVTIVIIAIVHLVIALGSYLATFEVSGFLFGVAPRPSDGLLHNVLRAVHSVTMFPLGWVAQTMGSDAQLLAWSLVVLNSLLWALVAYALFGGVLRRKRAEEIP
jgi:hypothetical protein